MVTIDFQYIIITFFFFLLIFINLKTKIFLSQVQIIIAVKN
jgi:hypothetical protein